MNCTIVKGNIALQQAARDNAVVAAGIVATTATTLDQAQAALRAAMNTRRTAEVGLGKCKTTTSPAARGYAATIAEQERVAKALRLEVERLSRQPEAAALAARFGDRRLCKYIVRKAAGHEMCDIARMNEVRIAFFQIALDLGMTSFETRQFWFDMPDGEHVGVQVK